MDVAGPAVSPLVPAPGAAGVDGLWRGAAVKQALAAVSDTSGKTSFADQFAAYNQIDALASSAGAPSPARTAAVAAWRSSAFAQRVQASTTSYMNAVTSAIRPRMQGSVAAQRQLDVFNSLSAEDQTINAGKLSPPETRANMQAHVGILKLQERALASGAYRPGADPSTYKDPALAGLAKLQAYVGSPVSTAWTARALAVLGAVGAERPPDRVDLSAAAMALTGQEGPTAPSAAALAQTSAPAAAAPVTPYRSGSVLDRSV